MPGRPAPDAAGRGGADGGARDRDRRLARSDRRRFVFRAAVPRRVPPAAGRRGRRGRAGGPGPPDDRGRRHRGAREEWRGGSGSRPRRPPGDLEDGAAGVSLWPRALLRSSGAQVVAPPPRGARETDALLDFARTGVAKASHAADPAGTAPVGAGAAPNPRATASVPVPGDCALSDFCARGRPAVDPRARRALITAAGSATVGEHSVAGPTVRVGPFDLVPCDLYAAAALLPSLDDASRRDAGLRWAALLQQPDARGSLSCARWGLELGGWGPSPGGLRVGVKRGTIRGVGLRRAARPAPSAAPARRQARGVARGADADHRARPSRGQYSHPPTVQEILDRKRAADLSLCAAPAGGRRARRRLRATVFGRLWAALRRSPRRACGRRGAPRRTRSPAPSSSSSSARASSTRAGPTASSPT